MEELVPWAQAAGVIALGAAGVGAGLWLSRRSWWIVGCVAAMPLVAAFGIGRWAPQLELVPPFAWVMRGRMEYALLAPAAAIALVPPTMRLRLARQRVLVAIFLAIVTANYAVLPFLWPALARPRLARLETQIDRDDVCRQTTSYTCGPAASVTALRKVDINATESELALAMYTSPALGTPADVLASTLQDRYAPLGVTCEYRAFDSVDELPRGTPVLAVVKYSFMVDHYVTVLDVDKDRIVVGDPAAGKLTYTRSQFERRWRFRGVVLRRETSGGINYLQAKNTAPDPNPALTPAY
jgi:predicted double-glycine peptidase